VDGTLKRSSNSISSALASKTLLRGTRSWGPSLKYQVSRLVVEVERFASEHALRHPEWVFFTA